MSAPAFPFSFWAKKFRKRSKLITVQFAARPRGASKVVNKGQYGFRVARDASADAVTAMALTDMEVLFGFDLQRFDVALVIRGV